MTAATENQDLPDVLVEELDDLDAATLRAVAAHVEQRLDDLGPALQDIIRSEANGEVVDIEDCGAYTLVWKYPPSRGDSENAPGPLSLYRVKRAEPLSGEESLHWSYLGDVKGVECENCGAVVNTRELACPHCGEAMGYDDGEV